MSPILGIWASAISGRLWEPQGAYDALATVTVPSGGSASIDFVGIPTGYKHLQLRVLLKRTGGTAADNTNIRFNSDSGSNYSWHQLYGDGSGVAAGAGTSQTSIRAVHSDSTANVYGVGVIDILDYASISKNKTVRLLAGWEDNNATTGYMLMRSGLWMNSSTAISSISLIPNSGTFVQYSQAALYGVK